MTSCAYALWGAATGTTIACRGDTQNGLGIAVRRIFPTTGLCVPFASEMLCQNGSETFYTSNDCPVYHYWSGSIRFGIFIGSRLACAIRELEPFRQVEINLDGGALERPPQCIGDGNVDLCGPVGSG